MRYDPNGKCGFEVAPGVKCGKPASMQFCKDHMFVRCARCQILAVRSCPATVAGKVCGQHLCGACVHAPVGREHVTPKEFTAAMFRYRLELLTFLLARLRDTRVTSVP